MTDLSPPSKNVFNDTIYQVDGHLNLVPYAVVELGKFKATKEAMFACTAEQLMKKWDFFNGKIALAAIGEKDGIIYLAHHDVTDPYTYSYDKNARQAFIKRSSIRIIRTNSRKEVLLSLISYRQTGNI